jgi:UDP-N-acetyl-D-glucosamine dehydrogenase
LTKALQQITAFLRKGVLVIVESTIPLGAIRETVLPVLEKSGLACGRGFYLAYCPERLDVGNVEWPLRKIPRVLGAIDSTSARKAAGFYSSILESEIIELSSVETVELTKLLENSFRELNIAFVNELSSIVPKFGISLNEAIKGASTKPFGFMPFFPGPGIGGNCIATSTFFLLFCLKQIKENSGLLSLSRSINTKSMLRVVNLVEEAMTELGKPPEGSVVTILGLSYKENVSDMTGSPAFAICDELVKRGYHVKLFDPCVKDHSTAKSLEDSLKESDCVVLTIKRKQFQRLSADYLERMKVRSIVDCKRQLDGGSIVFHGIIYKCIG